MDNRKFDLFKLTLLDKILGLFVPMIIIIVNSVEIHLLRKTMNKPCYEKMLLSSSLNDLISGVIGFTAVPYLSIIQDDFYIVLYWIAWGFGHSYFTLSTMMHLIIIGADRLWAVGSPFHHRVHASQRKLVVTIGLSWCLPMIFIVVNIGLVLVDEMNIKMIYVYMNTTMYSVVARIVAVADVLLVCCYSAIIYFTNTREQGVKTRKHTKQTNSISTLILCTGIMIVFIVFTTPYLTAFIIIWKRPQWLQSLSIYLLPLNQICNSTLYLVQQYWRNKRPTTA